MPQGGAGEADDARLLGAGRDGARRGGFPRRLRRNVEQRLGQRHAGCAIQHGMVHLHVEGRLPALQALDDMHFPQRLAAIHQFGMQARGAAF